MSPKIIVCGLGRTGYKIFRLLQQQGAAVTGISGPEYHQPAVDGHPDIVVGDMRSPAVLLQAGIREAQTLVLANHDDALNLSILAQARVLNPQIRIINRLYNSTLGDRLDKTLTDHVSLSVSALSAPIFAFAALGNRAIGQLHLHGKTWPVQEEIITENHPWLGKTLADLWENPKRMLIYYLPAQGEDNLVNGVAAGRRLAVGDHLILGNDPQTTYRRRSGLPQLVKALTNLKQYQRHVRPVTMVSLLLILTIFLATFTYVCVNFNTSVVDALYFSVGMITGAGGKEEVAEMGPDGVKIFTAIMMILGAGVIGICYALINDFILGSRIRQFWDAARIPTQKHYVICGLGGVGMAIVEQLHHQGHEVVVIECDPNNRFIPTARSLGVPIILEDANLDHTLLAANLEKADALLAVTSSDTVNLEMALTAKALNPHVNLVVRIQDNQFSLSVKEVFEFESVLCPLELATHSFAAAALGGRILGNGATEDLLWMAIATLITPKHPFCGLNIKTAAKHLDFVPLYLETASQERINGWELLEVSLQEGDVLYLTIPATELQKLWPGNVNEFNEFSEISV